MSNQESALTAAQVRDVQKRARLLIGADEVDAAIARMATAISESLCDTNPIVMCIMNGGLITTGKLVTQLNFPLQIDYLHATRYRNSTQGHSLNWLKPPSLTLENRTVLVVDDILDEGATLAAVIEYCKQANAKRVYSAVLTHKKHDRKVAGLKADYVGFEVEDSYVFGYGLDYKGYLRNAAGIYAIDPRDY